MKNFFDRLENSKPAQSAFAQFLRSCFQHHISRVGAALAYYFLISFFPLLLFISLLLSAISENLDLTQLLAGHMIPAEVISTIISLLNYSASLDRTTLMITAAALALYGGSRAVSCLSTAVNRSYHLEKKRNAILQLLINFAFSALFLLALIFTLVVIVSTPEVLDFLQRAFRIDQLGVTIYYYLRFILILVVFLFLLVILYSVVPNRRVRFKQAFPGALAASVGWVVVSMAFSLYVSNIGRYSLLYGTIGAVVVLMLWLYFTGLVLIAGSEFNYMVLRIQTRSGAQEEI